jgi:hypothetical protein
MDSSSHICVLYKVRWSYPCNRPWRPIGLWEVEAPTFTRQSAYIWRWGCHPYAPAALYPQDDSWTHFCQRLSRSQAVVRLEWLGQLKNPVASSNRDLSACNIVPQLITLDLIIFTRDSRKISFSTTPSAWNGMDEIYTDVGGTGH